MSSDASKITVLSQIRDKKDILFGQFSNAVTKIDKQKAWEEIAETAKSLNVLPVSKKWTDLRDTTWQNWRKKTMKKRDHKEKTGKGGGIDVQFDEIDSIVLDILGKESPVILGLEVPEASGSSNVNCVNPAPRETTPLRSHSSLSNFLGEDPFLNQIPPQRKAIEGRKRKSVENADENELKKRKINAQIKAMELDNFKKQLEIFEFEEKRHLPHSKLTHAFFEENYEDYIL